MDAVDDASICEKLFKGMVFFLGLALLPAVLCWLCKHSTGVIGNPLPISWLRGSD